MTGLRTKHGEGSLFADEQLAKALLCTNYGAPLGLAIWDRWDDRQRAEAVSVAANFSPILTRLAHELGAWLADVEGR